MVDAKKAWKKLLSEGGQSDDIIVMSPFITGPILPEIANESNSKNLTVLTALNAQSIHSGSIDLDILRELLNLNCNLRTVRNLHAKLMLKGKTVIIGSQNFTRGGQHNLELSVQEKLSTKSLKKINKFIESVVNQSVQITLEMVDSLEDECLKLESENMELSVQYSRIDKMVYEPSHAKEWDFDQAKINAKSLSAEKRVSTTHELKLVNSQSGSSKFQRSNECQNGYFWEFPTAALNQFELENGEVVELVRGRQYLCLDLDNLGAFYMPANITQFTYLQNERFYKVNNSWFTVELSIPEGLNNPSNICVKIDIPNDLGAIYELHLRYLFDGHQLVLVKKSYELNFEEIDCNHSSVVAFTPPKYTEDQIAEAIFVQHFLTTKRNKGIRPAKLFNHDFYSLGVGQYDGMYNFLTIEEMWGWY